MWCRLYRLALRRIHPRYICSLFLLDCTYIVRKKRVSPSCACSSCSRTWIGPRAVHRRSKRARHCWWHTCSRCRTRFDFRIKASSCKPFWLCCVTLRTLQCVSLRYVLVRTTRSHSLVTAILNVSNNQQETPRSECRYPITNTGWVWRGGQMPRRPNRMDGRNRVV